jgi:predicted nucleic acid-binding Zn ribbon protein
MDGENGIEWNENGNEEEVSSEAETEEGIVTWGRTPDEVPYPRVHHATESRDISPSKHCLHCGERISAAAEICPRCGARVSESRESKGGALSLIAGIIVGFFALLFLGAIPIVGPILAGLIGGIVAGGGAWRGAGVGFLSGSIGFVVLAIIILGGTSVGSGSFIETLILIFGEFLVLALLVVGLLYGLLCMIGGAIGGLIRK